MTLKLWTINDMMNNWVLQKYHHTSIEILCGIMKWLFTTILFVSTFSHHRFIEWVGERRVWKTFVSFTQSYAAAWYIICYSGEDYWPYGLQVTKRLDPHSQSYCIAIPSIKCIDIWHNKINIPHYLVFGTLKLASKMSLHIPAPT